MQPKFVRAVIQFAAGLGFTMLVATAARAIPDFQADLFARYPNAVSLGCAACHADPANGVLNNFGQAFLEGGLAFTPALEAQDSDGDGVPNGEELKASPASNPGDPQSRPGMGPPTTSPAATDGAALYGSYCASCHGALATSAKRGASVSRLQSGIAGNMGGMGYLSMLTPAQLDAIAAALATTSRAVSSSNYTGLWWNPAESGWGISLNHQGDTVFAALFTYSDAGTPMWLVMSSGPKQADGRTFAGTLHRMRGPAFDAVPFTPLGAADMTAVGNLSITFESATSATLTYAMNGVTVTKRIVPQVFGGAAATCTATTGSRAALTNYQDLWWNPAESGWGLTLTHQADTLFAALFTYDRSGNDLWLVMTQGTKQADGSWRGDLYRTRGPSFNAQPFTPLAAADVTKVGEMRLAFSDGATGTLVFSVDGKSVTKAISRQVFAATTPSCTSPVGTVLPVAGTDGPTLYASYCASCHQPLSSSTKGGTTLARLQFAISGNVGGMGSLANLATAQLEAIVAALAPLVPTAPACGSCHSVPPTTGGHVPHGTRATCATCHGAGYGLAAVNAATHNNGVKDVLAAIGWNAAARSCTNGCHGAGTWSTTSTLGCTSCHGAPPATGAHARHNTAYACSTCHGAGYTASTVNAATHRNGTKETLASIGWNAGTQSCANSCHGSTPWSPTATFTCTTCHGVPPATGGHAKHDTRFACSSCHGAGYSSSAANSATHRNGVKEVIASVGWNSAGKTCTNSCHGAGTWSATATLPCSSCHGVPPSTGRHSKHRSRECSACHGPGYTSTTVVAATHNNGTKNMATSSGWTASTRSCANSCHGRETW